MQEEEGAVRATRSYTALSSARNRAQHATPRGTLTPTRNSPEHAYCPMHGSGMLLRGAAEGKSAPAIFERLRGATALHTTTHRRPQTSMRAGPFDYGHNHTRPGGRLRGGGEGRGGLQRTTAGGHLDVTDTDPTRASHQRGCPQLTHIAKDCDLLKRKKLAVKSCATGFQFSSPTSERDAGARRPAPPLGHSNLSICNQALLQRTRGFLVAPFRAPCVA
jgi:hypothetical protein